MSESEENSQPPVLHVVVVGFHHKRGCQVDYSYPPLIPGQPNNSSELPDEWKHLPFLALPDGAHNYEEDTIYFHLPGKGSSKDTVYGVSCYRQIDTKDLKSQQAEYTRGTVQKSVCVLSTLPLYGLIQAKLKLITHAYFSERDFSQTAILEDLYKSLNLSLHSRLLDDSQIFLGLDLRELVLRFKHKILVIFKLLMLEKRVLFYCSPAEQLCSSVLSFISLYPGMLQNGLKEAACYRYYKPTTPSLVLEDFGIDTKEYMNIDMSHVPNYSNRRPRRIQTRDKPRSSQMSKGKVDVTDTTDESTVGTFSKSSQDNLNTNFNRGNNTDNSDFDFDGIEDGNKESDLLTSAARASVYRRSLRRTNGEQGSPEKNNAFSDEDLVSEHTITNEKSHNNNIRTDSSEQKMKKLRSVSNARIDSRTFTRNTEFVKNNAGNNSRNTTTTKQCNRLSRANLRENQKKSRPKSEQPRHDLDNISAYSSESMDVNARINAYFDTLAQKHDDSTSTCSISSYDTSSRDDPCTSSALSDTATSSRLSEWSMISSDVTISSRASRASLDVTNDSDDMFPNVKVLEDELLEMIDHELYGPYFDDKRISSSTNTDSCISQTSTSSKPTSLSTQSLTDTGTDYESTPKGSTTDLDRERESCRFSQAEDFVVIPNTPAPTKFDIDTFGFPLALFGKGALCHPYISLQQHDLLQDVNVRSFTIGASNALFKHQRHLVDVLVEVDEGKVQVYDHELRRNLHLSTADLRFADFIVKNVADEHDDVFLDQTGWEGGDEWIRAQFKVYLLSMLATEAHGNTEQEADFNDNFVRAWKTTHNYRIWKSKEFENMDYIHPGHPFTGGLGVSDMKIKLQSAMQTTDRGKKLNSTITKTSDAFFHTGKAVGGALHSAKSAVSSWFSSFAGGEWKIDEEEAEKEAQRKEAEQKKKEEKTKKDEEKKKADKDRKDKERKLEKQKKEQEKKTEDQRAEEQKLEEMIQEENKLGDGVKRLYLIEEERRQEEERKLAEIKRREEEMKQRQDEQKQREEDEIKSMLFEVDKAVEMQMEKEFGEEDEEGNMEEEEEEEESKEGEDLSRNDGKLIETDVDTGEEITSDEEVEGQTILEEIEGQTRLDKIEGEQEPEEIDEFVDALEVNENKRNEIRWENTRVTLDDDDDYL